MSTGESIRGRCLCGAIELRLTPPTEMASYCHCESCRRAHAAPFVAWTSVPEAAFRIEEGADALRSYDSSDGVHRSFCGTCGSPLVYRADKTPGRVYVPIAALVDELDRELESHVSYEEHPRWLEGLHELPAYRGTGTMRKRWR